MTATPDMPVAAFLALHSSACADGQVFARRFQTMSEVWSACERSDWMLWILDRLPEAQRPTQQQAAQFACACVRTTPLGDGRVVWDLLTDERSRAAIETTERWLQGQATIEEVGAADAAAWAAAWAADAAASADAADAAAWAAAWAASSAASSAASAACASWTSAAAARASWTSAAARAAAAQKHQADLLRTIVPNPFTTVTQEAK